MNRFVSFFFFLICSVLQSQNIERITNGHAIPISLAPYQASLYLNDSHHCGCTILNEEWVLTAGHCFRNSMNPNDYYIQTGISHFDFPTNYSATYNIERIIRHPLYNNRTLDNDIALVKVSNSITFNNHTQPIILATTDENLVNIESDAIVTGWGWTVPDDMYSGSRQLMKVSVPIISNDVAAQQLVQQNSYRSITNNMIATGSIGPNRIGPCHGDSGGPLVVNDNGTNKQIGIVSWGVPNCPNTQNSPSIYTKVENYVPWIENNLYPKSLEGEDIVCINNHITINLINNIYNSPTIWSSTNNIEIINSTNNSITINGLSQGYGLIRAEVNGKTLQKNIWIGMPTLSPLGDFSDDSYQYSESTLCTTPYYSLENSFELNVEGQTDWEVTKFGVFDYYISGNTLSILPYQAGNFALSLRAKNSCGITAPLFFQFKAKNCNSSLSTNDESLFLYNIYPNPTSDIVYVSTNSELLSENTPVFVGQLFDMMGILKHTFTIEAPTTEVFVSNLPQGLYLLRIKADNFIESHILSIK